MGGARRGGGWWGGRGTSLGSWIGSLGEGRDVSGRWLDFGG